MKKLFDIFHNGLRKTAVSISRKISSCLTGKYLWSEADYEQLEAALINADFGTSISHKISSEIKDSYEQGHITNEDDILKIAKSAILKIFPKEEKFTLLDRNAGLNVLLLVGVNGCGKTTTAGKLTAYYKELGFKVMLAACDTFRAAATEQLKLWGEKNNAYVVSGVPGADSASVAYDAVNAARSRGYDLLIVDTAGRQHAKKNLMEELGKIYKTIEKLNPGKIRTAIIIDGSMGANALSQVREFAKFCKLDGFICTKLDGSYKGGMVVAIKEKFNLPAFFIGLGEKIEDLQEFDAELFAEAVFEKIKE
ncbi:MAG TPA: signal recognition particle-docking protein FtsY [Lentisphaeria bacterium]|nr:MAG: signal recognition particle-docking protein FtsY [Lentisphaerae bacterium GWF2_38_69]HBM16174.1 signal recognition particle-docking protein FtsY [Lentisphaeria bacterium]